MNESMKPNPNPETDAVTTKPAWHAPVLEEVDYIKTENGVGPFNLADAAFYTA